MTTFGAAKGEDFTKMLAFSCPSYNLDTRYVKAKNRAIDWYISTISFRKSKDLDYILDNC